MKEYKHPKMEIDYFEDNLGLLFTASSPECMGYGGEGVVDPFACGSNYDWDTDSCTGTYNA